MSMKLATWNINSVRLRIDLVREFLEDVRPDVLCLQEIKVTNELFPRDAFIDMGYPHLAVNGQKGYHGVATISRIPLKKQTVREFCNKGDTRHISVTLEDDTEIHNFYVPAGGDEPNPDVNDKFQHKLDFLDEMTRWMKAWKLKDKARRVMVGDLNIAPLEHDVWSHKQLLKVVSHTPVEVERLDAVLKAGKWHDPVRHEQPEPEKLYSWWSYRAKDWEAANRGRRLDHIWVSPSLADKTSGTEILRDWRGKVKPSDHCPIVAHIGT